ncbi:MAG TPA: class I SAM-dependent RNA methyltransferase [Candidatus Gemmiger excrementavium]|uniref:Class I SAM-dependent RNA methyltransferase n=1 Tax=Candidatus Gemmiger excrementavium TaxID=2838608 RepID=A0A9D2JG54_9FIRM|nr:class I SAM-dependent RNA methyltransferase [Candidatus Gemmiger excrementavium]
MSTLYTLVAPCFFGTESTLHFEIKRLGAQNIQVTDGRIAFQGGAELIAAANLNLRTAERVLLQLATYRALTFDELFDGCYAIPWEELLPADAAFPVKGSSLSSQLSSVPACQSIIKKAIVKRLLAGHKTSALPETGDVYKVRFSLRKDTVEIYLDTSGDGLHKRGYRRNATLAPIKETLAAAIADLGRVRRDSLVQDPFCGSGTLVIEAAQKALNLAPGLRRRFAAEHFSFVPPEAWAQQRQKALEEVRKDAAFEGVGYDIDPAAVALANANAKLAGVGERCRFEVADVKDFAPAQNATVLTNPPYGERLGDASEAAALARTLGQVWQHSPAQGLYAITADGDFEQHFGKKAARRRKIYNGMIPCQLYMYFEQPKR